MLIGKRNLYQKSETFIFNRSRENQVFPNKVSDVEADI